MTLTMSNLLATFALTLRNPRQAARQIVAWPLRRSEYWMVMALTVIVPILAAEVTLALVPALADPSTAVILANPFSFAAMQFVGVVLISGLILTVGRRFGGHATFDAVLSVLAWLQVILMTLQIAQFLALLVFPPLAGLIFLGSAGLTLWLMPTFVAEVHGFRSAFMTLLGMIGTLFALSVVLSLLIVVFFGPGVLPNV